jgi:hypothetical protein
MHLLDELVVVEGFEVEFVFRHWRCFPLNDCSHAI